jgi:hypothetical protein
MVITMLNGGKVNINVEIYNFTVNKFFILDNLECQI